MSVWGKNVLWELFNEQCFCRKQFDKSPKSPQKGEYVLCYFVTEKLGSMEINRYFVSIVTECSCFIIIWPKSGSNSCQSHITHFIIVRSPVCLHETMQIQRLVALLSRRMSAKQFSPLSLLWYSFVCIFCVLQKALPLSIVALHDTWHIKIMMTFPWFLIQIFVD